jgi:FtsP/CotA-like multicopper oxidase with cupredoxin domain
MCITSEDPMTDHLTKLTDRRSFLRRLLTTTSLVAAGAASAPAWAQSHGAHGPRVRNTAPATPAPLAAQGPAFANPPAISGSNGAYALNVTMRQAILGSQPVNVMAYVDANNPPGASAYLVAPTITITRNGQLVQPVSVVLTNNLPAEPNPAKPGPVTEAHVHDAPFGFYTTNLHVHGLHVDPLEDNVYIELQPAANGVSACAPTRANPVWVCNGSYTYSYNFGKAPISSANPTGTTKIPAGTYWYHPHKHGSVGVQVASGMAGAFIVQGDLDAIPGVADLTERVMVTQLVAYAIPAVDPSTFYGISQPAPPTNATMSINGQINPTIDMQYGEIQRWRFINATADQFFSLKVTGPSGTTPPLPELYAIAVDGVPLTNSAQGITVPFKLGTPLFQFPMGTASTFANAVMNEIAVLAPAQRLDLLVRMPVTPGGGTRTYQLQTVSFPPHHHHHHPRSANTQTIATIQVTGAKTTPDQLPASSAFNADALYRPPLRERSAWPTNPTQKIQFGFIEGQTGALVNNSTSATPFGVAAGNPPPPAAVVPPPPPAGASAFALPVPPSGAQLQLKLNAVDYWQVSSNPDLSIGFGPHAFHIHINSFMITKRNGVDISSARIWRDTARIDQPPQPTSPSSGVAASTGVGAGALSPIVPVEFVSQQVDYVGDFVMHCHFLEHEDSGMMWSVNIS